MQASVSHSGVYSSPPLAVARHTVILATHMGPSLAGAHKHAMRPVNVWKLPALAPPPHAARGRLAPCPAAVRVEFVVPDLALEFGEGVRVVGAGAALGAWDAAAAPVLQWTEGNIWKGTVELEAGPVEFKLVRVGGGGDAAWEDGDNRAADLPEGACRLVCPWGGPTAMEEAAAAAAEKKLRSAAGAAAQKARRVRSKQEDLSQKVAGLEEKVERSSTKLKSMKAGKGEGEEEGAAPAAAPAPTAPEPVAAAPPPPEPAPEPAPALDGVHLPPEMTQLAKGISCGADGTLTIEFSGAADGVDAATLAERLRA